MAETDGALSEREVEFRMNTMKQISDLRIEFAEKFGAIAAKLDLLISQEASRQKTCSICTEDFKRLDETVKARCNLIPPERIEKLEKKVEVIEKQHTLEKGKQQIMGILYAFIGGIISAVSIAAVLFFIRFILNVPI